MNRECAEILEMPKKVRVVLTNWESRIYDCIDKLQVGIKIPYSRLGSTPASELSESVRFIHLMRNGDYRKAYTLLGFINAEIPVSVYDWLEREYTRDA